MNNNTILAIAFLLAGTLFTASVAMAPAAYAGGDDHDDDNGDGNKQKVEDESAGAIADCDNNEVERAGFDCFAIAELEEDGGLMNGLGPIETGGPSVPPDTTTDTTGTEIMENPLFNLNVPPV
jgi:hypothetical protein